MQLIERPLPSAIKVIRASRLLHERGKDVLIETWAVDRSAERCYLSAVEMGQRLGRDARGIERVRSGLVALGLLRGDGERGKRKLWVMLAPAIILRGNSGLARAAAGTLFDQWMVSQVPEESMARKLVEYDIWFDLNIWRSLVSRETPPVESTDVPPVVSTGVSTRQPPSVSTVVPPAVSPEVSENQALGVSTLGGRRGGRGDYRGVSGENGGVSLRPVCNTVSRSGDLKTPQEARTVPGPSERDTIARDGFQRDKERKAIRTVADRAQEAAAFVQDLENRLGRTFQQYEPDGSESAIT